MLLIEPNGGVTNVLLVRLKVNRVAIAVYAQFQILGFSPPHRTGVS
jgi:hypothetical protein